MTALVVIGNGREAYLHRAIESAEQYLPNIDLRIMVNDTGDPGYAERLDANYPNFDALIHHGSNLGMAAAVQSGWNAALMFGAENVFHLEEDFILTAPIPLGEMRVVLEFRRDLASITLKRPPWAGIEVELGDQLAAICSLAEHREDPPVTRHKHIFSLNPSLIPRRVIEQGWPSGPLGVGNEAGMTTMLLAEGYWFSVWGTVEDPPLCAHIGYERGSEWQL